MDDNNQELVDKIRSIGNITKGQRVQTRTKGNINQDKKTQKNTVKTITR